MALQPRPTSVLDVGLGNGKYGFLCREYLHYWGRREDPDWRSADGYLIDGIEAFSAYIGTLQEQVYSHIILDEATEALGTMQQNDYDLVLLIDVLEHFDKQQGRYLLSECRRVGKATIVSTPIMFEPQGDAFGNTYEKHRSLWTSQMLHHEQAEWVFNSQDENWIAVYSDDSAYVSCIRQLLRYYSLWRKLLRLLVPYRLRSAFNTLSGSRLRIGLR